MGRARILVADDHDAMRKTIVHLLKEQFEVLAAVADGPAFLDAVDRLKPDLCIVDISMPTMSGIEVVQRIKATNAHTKIVFLTLHDDSDFRAAALAAGADGYVTKARMGGDLLPAIKAALAGRGTIRPGN